MRIPVPWVFVLTYLVGVALEFVVPLRNSLQSIFLIKITGFALLMFGALIAASGLVTFKKAGTTTVPGQLSSQLVTWGPYRFSRNPMYVGLTIAYLGEAGILMQLWPVLLLPLTLVYLNWGVIPVEEGKLRQAFGEEYDHYRMRVRRWI